MYVVACKLYESGCPMPRHRLSVLRPHEAGLTGWFVYKESWDSNHRRTMWKARLIDEETGGDVFPELLDAVIMLAENGVVTVRGQERDSITRRLTGMAWWCRILHGESRTNAGDYNGPGIV